MDGRCVLRISVTGLFEFRKVLSARRPQNSHPKPLESWQFRNLFNGSLAKGAGRFLSCC